MVIGDMGWAERWVDACADEHFEFIAHGAVADVQSAIRTASPDVVLWDVDAGPLPGVLTNGEEGGAQLVLVGDAAAAVADQRFAAATLAKDANVSEVRALCERLSAPRREPAWTEALGELTTEQLADRLAQAVREGIVGAAATGKDVKVSLGDGAEVLAAALSAVAKVREQLTEASDGKVQFRDGPASQLFTPDRIKGSEAVSLKLGGKRVLIACADEAIHSHLARLASAMGGQVTVVTDGAAALLHLRAEFADVVVSDVLMPKLDGFALQREIERDPVLHGTPIILLTFKEHLEAEVRALAAVGTLTREALLERPMSAQLASHLRAALLPRLRLEERLPASDDVGGRIEGLGVPALLRLVGAHRPSCEVVVRDAANLFEMTFIDGTLASLTQTGTSGAFARGPRALPLLFGVTAGRFDVHAMGRPPSRNPFKHDLETIIGDGTRAMGARLDALSVPMLSKVARVVVDEDALAGAPDISEAQRERLRRLSSGTTVQQLFDEGVGVRELERELIAMARRGLAIGAFDDGDYDFVEICLARRQQAEQELPPESTIAGQLRAVQLTDLDEQGVRSEMPPSLEDAFAGASEGAEDVEGSVEDTGAFARIRETMQALDSTQVRLQDDSLGNDLGEEAPVRLTEVLTRPSTIVLGLVSLLLGYFGMHAISALESRPGPEAVVEEGAPSEDSSTGLGDREQRAPAAETTSGNDGAEPVDSDASGADTQQNRAREAPSRGLDTSRSTSKPLAEALELGTSTPASARELRALASGEGLLVVTGGEGAAGTVRVRSKRMELGTVPLRTRLREGLHELVFVRGDESSYRYVQITAGYVRTIEAPF